MTEVIVNQAAGDADEIVVSRQGILRRLFRQPLTSACFAGVGSLVLVAILAPILAPYDPTVADVANRLRGPSSQYWLGTDMLGRDTFSRLIYGARTAVITSSEAVGLALILGVPPGLPFEARAMLGLRN